MGQAGDSNPRKIGVRNPYASLVILIGYKKIFLKIVLDF